MLANSLSCKIIEGTPIAFQGVNVSMLQVKIIFRLTPVSQVEVGCPWAKGLQLQLHPKVEEHPQAYQPTTQPHTSVFINDVNC